MEFWYRYKNLNPCHTNPCLNGGICTQDREDFLCLCPPGFHGKTCNSGKKPSVTRINNNCRHMTHQISHILYLCLCCVQRCQSVAIEMAAACSTVKTWQGALVFSVAVLMDLNWRLMERPAHQQVKLWIPDPDI
ncbi:hypothetical protein ILYODFUR_037252 [Ilyodon furcidens]|uniref:EGF-like domain-containing protein n=1 Tax=Ilyodon furcidens TaxID=33524 RepID=A0ABV0UP41_9TELE